MCVGGGGSIRLEMEVSWILVGVWETVDMGVLPGSTGVAVKEDGVVGRP